MRIPYFPFYPADYRLSELPTLSLAARGLYLELRVIAHTSERYGYLQKNREPLKVNYISRVVGAPESDILSHVTDLCNARVLVMDEGILCFPDMAEQEAKRSYDRSRKSKHRRRKTVTTLSHSCHTDAPDPCHTKFPIVTATETETVTERPKDEKAVSVLPGEAEFQALWAHYPRRIGQKAAKKHFLASVKTPADVDACRKALFAYKNKLVLERTAEEFIQHGSTWFNNWRDWIDFKPGNSMQMNDEKKVKVEQEKEVMRKIWRQTGLSDCHGKPLARLGIPEVKNWCCSQCLTEQFWATGKTEADGLKLDPELT